MTFSRPSSNPSTSSSVIAFTNTYNLRGRTFNFKHIGKSKSRSFKKEEKKNNFYAAADNYQKFGSGNNWVPLGQHSNGAIDTENNNNNNNNNRHGLTLNCVSNSLSSSFDENYEQPQQKRRFSRTRIKFSSSVVPVSPSSSLSKTFSRSRSQLLMMKNSAFLSTRKKPEVNNLNIFLINLVDKLLFGFAFN